jgi:hypothetical protein
MRKIFISVVLFLSMVKAFGDEEKAVGVPIASTGVTVVKVDGSGLKKAEKWIDKADRTVCYIVEDDQQNSRSAAISCVKVN